MLLWPDSEGGQNIFMQAKTNYIIIWNENVTASIKIWGTRYLAWELYADSLSVLMQIKFIIICDNFMEEGKHFKEITTTKNLISTLRCTSYN